MSFELIDSDGNTYIDEKQEDILKNKKEQEESELRKITKEDALAKLKEYKEQLELELAVVSRYYYNWLHSNLTNTIYWK